MDSKHSPQPSSAPPDFFALQLRIAQRADEYVRQHRLEGRMNRHCWLLAEAEVLSATAESTPTPGEGGNLPEELVELGQALEPSYP